MAANMPLVHAVDGSDHAVYRRSGDSSPSASRRDLQGDRQSEFGDAWPARDAPLRVMPSGSRKSQRGSTRTHSSHRLGSSSTQPSGRLIATPQRLDV